MRFLKAVCGIILAAILTVGLWPFNFRPPNKANWLTDRNGIHVFGPGIVFSDPSGWDAATPIFPGLEMTLEIWLHPRKETPNLPSILTFHDGLSPDIFLLGQWKSHLIIRYRPAEEKNRKPGKAYQEIGLRNALIKDRDVFITVTSKKDGKDGTSIFVNGRLAKNYPRHSLLGGMTSKSIRLILGNSPTGQSYWPGEILGMGIHDRVIAADEIAENYLLWQQQDASSLGKRESLISLYLFDERQGRIIRNAKNEKDALRIPEIFAPERRVFLEKPWEGQGIRWSASSFLDAAINILGFMPLGFFFFIFFMRQTSRQELAAGILTAIIGIAFSLAVELAQAYLPTRNSSLMDLGYNALGTILGLVAAKRRRAPGALKNATNSPN